MSDKEAKLDVIRAALHQRIEETSLRATAIEVGMSPTGLREMIEGATPYKKTVDRITTWYALWQKYPPPVDPTTRHTMLVDLTRHLPKHRRESIIAEILRILDSGAESNRTP